MPVFRNGPPWSSTALKWADAKRSAGPARPPLIMVLTVELSMPRFTLKAHPYIFERAKKVPFSVDTVSRVASVASEEAYTV